MKSALAEIYSESPYPTPTIWAVIAKTDGEIPDYDIGTLSDWASEKAKSQTDSDWKRSYSLIREGCDLLLRRRARSRVSR